jgi:hypothetical protein
LQAYDKGKEHYRIGGVEVRLGRADKVSARDTRIGRIDLRPWRRGSESSVTAAVQQWLGKQIAQQPDLTLMELQKRLQQTRGCD